MSVPSVKSPVIDKMLKAQFGVDRRGSIEAGLCVSAPMGCGQPVGAFTGVLDAREYEISGLCEKCQQRYF